MPRNTMPSHMMSCVIFKTERSVLIDGGGGLVAKECSALVTPQTVAHQAPLSMGFPRQEHWSGLPFPSPGDLPDPRIEPTSSALQADSLLPSHQKGSIVVAHGLSRSTFPFVRGPNHVSWPWQADCFTTEPPGKPHSEN